jgi:hypothetical protein
MYGAACIKHFLPHSHFHAFTLFREWEQKGAGRVVLGQSMHTCPFTCLLPVVVLCFLV